jgi:hypothetical protein
MIWSQVHRLSSSRGFAIRCGFCRYLAVLSAIWLLLSAPASAQPVDDGEYDREITAAMAAHQEQRWLDARAHFERAHTLRPSARTLRGMGTSAYEAGQFALALRDLRAALVHPERPLSAELRSAVEALLSQGAGPRVGEYVFRVEPSGATLTVSGGTAVTGAEGQLLFEAGDYRVTAAMPGYLAQEVELHVLGGEREEIRLVLSVVAPAPSITPSPSPMPAAVTELAPGPRVDTPDPPGRNTVIRPLAYASTALTAVSFGLSGVLYGVARARIDDIADECRSLPTKTCTPELANSKERTKDVPRLERGMTALIVVGASSAVAATVLWVLSARERRRGAHSAFVWPVRF